MTGAEAGRTGSSRDARGARKRAQGDSLALLVDAASREDRRRPAGIGRPHRIVERTEAEGRRQSDRSTDERGERDGDGGPSDVTRRRAKPEGKEARREAEGCAHEKGLPKRARDEVVNRLGEPVAKTRDGAVAVLVRREDGPQVGNFRLHVLRRLGQIDEDGNLLGEREPRLEHDVADDRLGVGLEVGQRRDEDRRHGDERDDEARVARDDRPGRIPGQPLPAERQAAERLGREPESRPAECEAGHDEHDLRPGQEAEDGEAGGDEHSADNRGRASGKASPDALRDPGDDGEGRRDERRRQRLPAQPVHEQDDHEEERPDQSRADRPQRGVRKPGVAGPSGVRRLGRLRTPAKSQEPHGDGRRLGDEDGTPGEELGQDPPEPRTGREPDGRREDPGSDSCPPAEERKCGDEEERRSDTLRGAEPHEELERAGGRAAGRGERKTDERERREPYRPDARHHGDQRGSSRDDGQVVRGDHPGRGADIEAELAHDLRNREDDDRRIGERDGDRQEDECVAKACHGSSPPRPTDWQEEGCRRADRGAGRITRLQACRRSPCSRPRPSRASASTIRNRSGSSATACRETESSSSSTRPDGFSTPRSTARSCRSGPSSRAIQRRERLGLRFPDGSEVADEVRLGEPSPTNFWGRSVAGRFVEGQFSEALAEYVGRPVRLVRAVARGGAFDVEVVTLLSEASVEELGRQTGQAGLDGRRFRMLIGLAGCEPHEEDTWNGRRFRVGTAAIRVGGPVPRCVITTKDPETGAKDLDTLREIKRYRGVVDGDVNFGVYATVEEPGTVSLGDELEPL